MWSDSCCFNLTSLLSSLLRSHGSINRQTKSKEGCLAYQEVVKLLEKSKCDCHTHLFILLTSISLIQAFYLSVHNGVRIMEVFLKSSLASLYVCCPTHIFKTMHMGSDHMLV